MSNKDRYKPFQECVKIACANCDVYISNMLRNCNKECPQKKLKDEYRKKEYEALKNELKGVNSNEN